MKTLPAIPGAPAAFLAFVFRRWREDRCPQIAASLTFTTVLALVPLFTVVVATLSVLPWFEDMLVQVKIFLLLNLVPEIAGKIITVHMEQFAAAAARLTSVSLAALFAMALAMLFTVDRSLNAIWRVDRRRSAWVSAAGYTALLALGPVLMGASLWATSWLAAASLGRVDVSSAMEATVLRFVPVTVSALAFFLVYRIIPNRHVPARHALAGGVLAAVVFEAMKSVFAAYIRAVPTYHLVYGAFASIPIFLLWLYLSWLVVLLGAEFTASLASWRDDSSASAGTPEPALHDVFEVGRALADGGPLPLAELRSRTGIPDDRLEALLAELERSGSVRRAVTGWESADPGTGPHP